MPLRRGLLQEPAARPIGAKLELTYRCNLTCPFCYTDSPRRSREHAPDLSDEAWRDAVRQAIDLGIVEAVVTGGEPLLRRELALELLETLSAAGVGLTLNTNGWFVDDEVARRLAALRDLQVNLSLDGATPELHDAIRGVSGSWTRGLAALDRLVARHVRVRTIHVVTPSNAAYVDELLELVWAAGAASARLTTVGPIGAAARDGDWRVDVSALRRAARAFEARREAMPVRVVHATMGSIATIEDFAPGSLLIRPNGAVQMDSIRPFGFGRLPEDTLADAWHQIVAGWPQPELVEWAHEIRSTQTIREASVVPYRDESVALAGPAPAATAAAAAATSLRLGVPAIGTVGDLAAARAHVVGQALARHYVLGDVRWTDPSATKRVVRIPATRTTTLLNETATLVMDTCAGGTPAGAVDQLVARFPATDRGVLETDVLGAVRDLLARRVLVPAPV
jgi:MoaA/NifB/PqqE/SkfB family radical SAM enzyme